MGQLATVLSRLIYFYEMLIFAWCLGSFIPSREGSLLSDAKEVLNRVCAPYVGFFQRYIPPVAGLDFSPVVAVLVLTLLSRVLTAIIL